MALTLLMNNSNQEDMAEKNRINVVYNDRVSDNGGIVTFNGIFIGDTIVELASCLRIVA